MSTSPSSRSPVASTRSRQRWAVLVVIASAQLMIVLDNTVMNIALAPAQVELGIGDAERQWVVTAYALAFGSLLLLGGRLSDRLGRKRAFLIGLVGAGLAAVVGGAASSFAILVAARAVEGAFGALVAPAALSMLTTAFADGRGRPTALGVFSAVVASGATVGLLVSGLITQCLGWRWCMDVTAVIALGAVVAGMVLLPVDRGARAPIDIPGALAVSAGLLGLVYGFADAGISGWSSLPVVVALVAGVVLLIGFVARQRRAPAPLLPLGVVWHRDRGGAFLTLFVVASGMYTTTLFTTYFLQRTLGFSPLATGVAFLPMVAFIIATSTTVPSTLLPRWGPKVLVVSGLTLGGLALFWLSRISPDSDYAFGVLGPLMVLGAAVGTTNAASVSTTTRGVAPADAGAGSALLNTMPQLGGAVAVALLSTVAGMVTASSLGDTQAAASVAGYSAALFCASLVFVAGAIVCGSLIRGRQSSPHLPPTDSADEWTVTAKPGS